MYWPELRFLKRTCQVFQRLIERKLPVLADHFEHHELNVSLFALGWFQTLFLYIPSMPTATVSFLEAKAMLYFKSAIQSSKCPVIFLTYSFLPQTGMSYLGYLARWEKFQNIFQSRNGNFATQSAHSSQPRAWRNDDVFKYVSWCHTTVSWYLDGMRTKHQGNKSYASFHREWAFEWRVDLLIVVRLECRSIFNWNWDAIVIFYEQMFFSYLCRFWNVQHSLSSHKRRYTGAIKYFVIFHIYLTLFFFLNTWFSVR